MNKEEIKKKFYKKWETDSHGIGDFSGSSVGDIPLRDREKVWNFFEPLIQESNREAIEKFRSFCEGEVYEKRLSDEHYVLVSILIDAYLSSIGKEEDYILEHDKQVKEMEKLEKLIRKDKR